VSKDSISVDPVKVDKVQAWPLPKTIQAVCQFLSLCSYYHWFMQNFAQIAKPLHKLTEQNAKFKWTQECQKPLSSCAITYQLLQFWHTPTLAENFYCTLMPVILEFEQFCPKKMAKGMRKL